MTNLGEIIYWREKSLYLNITNRCTNNCIFCVRKYQNGVFGFNLILQNEPTIEEIFKALKDKITNQFNEIVFTGFGEPLLRLDAVCQISQYIKKKYKNKYHIRIDTNGLAELYHPNVNVIEMLHQSKIDELSVSLNAENKNKYFLVCKPEFGIKSFDAMLHFAFKAKEFFKITFTIVSIPQIDILACKQLANNLEIPLRIRNYSGPSIEFDQ